MIGTSMTIEAVRERVARIREMARDYEAAHSAEDELHRDVLREIRDGAPHARRLADEALKTIEIDFPRHTA